MRYRDWEPKRQIETQYARSLAALINEFAKVLRQQDVAGPEDVIDLYRDFSATKPVQEYVSLAIQRMVTALRVSSARTWREAATTGTRGREIYRLLQQEMRGPIGSEVHAIIKKNAELISTFDRTVAQEVNGFVGKEMLKGRRAQDITGDLVDKFPEIAQPRLALIARTEVSKASTALMRARAQEINASWYMWRTSEDVRVRKAHKLMDKVLVSWSDPPSPEALDHEKRAYGPYHAGEIFNCRCYPQPVISLDLVKWPAKVYRAGKVKYVTRAEFTRLAV